LLRRRIMENGQANGGFLKPSEASTCGRRSKSMPAAYGGGGSSV